MRFRTYRGIPHTFSYKNSDAVMKVRCISWLWLVSYSSLAIRFMDRDENAATQESFKLLSTPPDCDLVFRGPGPDLRAGHDSGLDGVKRPARGADPAGRVRIGRAKPA